jgi:hypothetical protein
MTEDMEGAMDFDVAQMGRAFDKGCDVLILVDM